MKRKKQEEPEHVISERAVEALRANEAAPRAERRELSRDEIEEFLQLVSQVQPPSLFKRKLEMSAADVEFYKNSLGINNEDEARRELRRMRHEDETTREREIIQNRKEQREAERVANERLQAMEREKAERASQREVPDATKIREDEAAKQRRFAAQQEAEEEARKSDWRLPLEGNPNFHAEQIDTFRRDIMHRGMAFCRKKYGVSSKDIRAEAARLGLRINWDIVHR